MKYQGLLIAICLLFGTVGAQQIIRENPSSERDARKNSITDTLDFHEKVQTRKKVAIKGIGPDPSVSKLFKEFLKEPKTGIARLVLPTTCRMSLKERILNRDKFSKDCPTQFLVGNGSHYSFRVNDYVFSAQADISLANNVIHSSGLFSQGLMVNLGDVPIIGVSLQSAGVKYLANYIPASTVAEADEHYSRFDQGILHDNHRYARAFRVEKDRTYALRVIAYRSDKKIQINLSEDEKRVVAMALRSDSEDSILDPTAARSELLKKSDLFYRDDRKDIIVVFRIVEADKDGGVTFIWKELQSIDSPKI